MCRPLWEVHSVFYHRKLNDVTAICYHYHQYSHWSFWLSWSSDCIIWQGGLDRRAGCWLVRVWSILLPWNCCSDDSDGRLKPLSSFAAFFLGIMLVSLEPSWLSVLLFMILIFFFYHHIPVFYIYYFTPFRIHSKWSCFPFFFLPACLHPKRHFPAFLFPTFIMKLAHVQRNWKNGTVDNTHMLYTRIQTYTFFLLCCSKLSGDVSLPSVHFDLLFEKKDTFYISTMPLWHLRKLASQYSDFSTCPNNSSRSFVKPRSNSDSGSTFGEVSAVSSRERFFPFCLLMMLAF